MAATESTKRQLKRRGSWPCWVGIQQPGCCFIRVAARGSKVDAYRAALAEAGVIVSMSRTGN